MASQFTRRSKDRRHTFSIIHVSVNIGFSIILCRNPALGPLLLQLVRQKPERKDGFEQLENYLNTEASPVGLWSNGTDAIIV